jgi:hypothetical protein
VGTPEASAIGSLDSLGRWMDLKEINILDAWKAISVCIFGVFELKRRRFLDTSTYFGPKNAIFGAFS